MELNEKIFINMEKGYSNKSHVPSLWNKIILVYNHEVSNIIVNLPCIAETILLKYKENLIGIWKIKTKK